MNEHIPSKGVLMPSKRHMQIYGFIKEYLKEHGYPPTVREIGKVVGLKSSSNVCHHLQKLEEKDLIKRVHGSSRAIQLVGYRVELVPEEER